MKIICISVLITLLVMVGNAKSEEGHHEHTAPHGGTLVVFGEEFAHLELVLDANQGKLTAYVLDGEAENPVRISQEEIELKISIKKPGGQEGEKFSFFLKLMPVANVLTGETVGDTSEFTGQADKLKGTTNFNAVLTMIIVKGKEFKNLTFNFPKGNEEEK
jgi:hypothetical protein